MKRSYGCMKVCCKSIRNGHNYLKTFQIALLNSFQVSTFLSVFWMGPKIYMILFMYLVVGMLQQNTSILVTFFPTFELLTTLARGG